MFALYSSNKTETLLADLTALIKNTPLSSPFEKEVFLVQQPGMERWLSQQLASQFKVWGNYQFLVPGLFFNTIAQKINSRLNDAVFDRDVMLWRIEGLLRDLRESEFTPLAQYLADGNAALKRYQLARKLVQLFDQYQILRPDMLTAWQQGQPVCHSETELWQKSLWLRIFAQLGGQDKGLLWRNVIEKLSDAEPGSFSRYLPGRIFVFGVHHLPPVMLDFLQGLARHCQLHFFLLNPLPSVFAQASRPLQTQHPLLVSLGQKNREFQEMLLERGLWAGVSENISLAEKPATILQQLQNDFLNNPQYPQQLCKDDSIGIHACHSRMREVEVLRNQLLNALEQDSKLELRDIIVMSPDIQLYVPFISAVFNDIQHTIADRSQLATNHVLNAFIDFLQMGQSRFGWKSVVDLLERPIIYPGFGLSDGDLALIKHWLQDMRVRWGKSAGHRQELGVYACAENTWQAALDRLLMGYALGDDGDFVNGVLPYRDIEGSSAQALGGLHDFVQLLFAANAQFQQPMALADWGKVLYGYADQLLVAADPSERRELNELLLELSSTLADVHQEDVDLQLVLLWLQDQAGTQHRDAGSGFLRGQLTFCAMQPMRVIPFKVVALLGMNEGDFPRMDQRPTFDLTAQDSRKGDSSKRSDDRYQFLEILLSVRQQLIITYIGQSIMHNNRIAPAIVVSELLDVLRASYQLSDLIIYHPLHAFSVDYFKGRQDLFSFSETDCATAKALSQPKVEPGAWWQGMLTPTEDKVIELGDLFRFFQHPQRYFMKRQLDVRFYGIEAEPEEREDFALDNLDRYFSLNHGIQEKLEGRAISVEKLQAQGRWLSAVMGELEAERQERIIDDFVERINALELGEKCDDLRVDIAVGEYRLVGTLGNRYENGSLFYRYAALKGKDFLCAVLHHLIINRLQPQTTALLSADDEIVLLPAHCQEHYLPGLIDIYRQGQQRPDAFFVEPALAYVQQACKPNINAAEQALDKAKAVLSNAITQTHELELQRLYGAVTDLDALIGATFEQPCRMILLPLWQVTHQ